MITFTFKLYIYLIKYICIYKYKHICIYKLLFVFPIVECNTNTRSHSATQIQMKMSHSRVGVKRKRGDDGERWRGAVLEYIFPPLYYYYFSNWELCTPTSGGWSIAIIHIYICVLHWQAEYLYFRHSFDIMYINVLSLCFYTLELLLYFSKLHFWLAPVLCIILFMIFVTRPTEQIQTQTNRNCIPDIYF